MFTITGKHTSALVTIDNVEAGCQAQVVTFCNHPAFTNPIAIMPDCHEGKGVPIGFSMPITDKIISSIVGVDIGCGMLAHECSFDFDVFSPEDWVKFDAQMRRDIPTGFSIHHEAVVDLEQNPEFWEEVKNDVINLISAWHCKFGTKEHFFPVPPNLDWKWFQSVASQVGTSPGAVVKSIGTLGGGNHFIEVGKSKETGRYWIVLHSGSRNFGLKVATYYQQLAEGRLASRRKELVDVKIKQITSDPNNIHDRCRLIAEAKKDAGLDVSVQTKGLEWLEGIQATEYLLAMILAQKVASWNRKMMLDQILHSLAHRRGVKKKDLSTGRQIESIHNYIDFRDLIIRKGAIRSYIGEQMIIPFNMRDGMLLCEGLSNKDWNFTAPHGAGRVLSRSKARETLKMEEFKETMRGINTTSVSSQTIDESPMAYKDSAMIEEAIQPTCKVLEHIVPAYNMKDKSGKE